jgi:thiamine transport system permease protein
LARYRFAGRRAVLAAVTVPFMLPTVVVGAAFLALLPHSWHDSARAVIVAHVFFNIAVVVRLLAPLWGALPTDLTAAARTLGARPWQVLRHVVLPLLRPGLWAAGTVVFLFTFTAYGTVRLLGGPGNTTIEVEVARRATQLGDVDGAAVLSLLQLVALAVVVALAARFQRRSGVALAGAPSVRTARTTPQRLLVAAVTATTAVAMVTPLAVMVALAAHRRGVVAAAWRSAHRVAPGVGLGSTRCVAVHSLRFAAVATLISVVAECLAALAIGGPPPRAPARCRADAPLGTSAVIGSACSSRSTCPRRTTGGRSGGSSPWATRSSPPRSWCAPSCPC